MQQRIAIEEALYGDFDKGYGDLQTVFAQIDKFKQSHGGKLPKNLELTDEAKYKVSLIDKRHKELAAKRRAAICYKLKIAGLLVFALTPAVIALRRYKHNN